MLEKILSLVGLQRKPPTPPVRQERSGQDGWVKPTHKPDPSRKPVRRPDTPAIPVYPPTDAGIQYDPVDEVIGTQRELIRRIRLAAGTDEASFEQRYMSVVRNLATHVNQLPASETGTHNAPGGLFRLALEIGFFSMQAAEARVFAGREGIERRRILEPRWRYATFLAGICCELHRPVTTMMVCSKAGEIWPAYRISLGEWLQRQGEDRFFVRWIDLRGQIPTGQGAASHLAYQIIPDESLQYLHEGSNRIVPIMLDAITGAVKQGSLEPLYRVIEEVREKVMQRDTAIRPANYGKLTAGVQLEPHLLDAMRRLVKNGAWKVNVKKARLWYGKDGLFLVWKTAAKEILEVLGNDGVAGIPQDSQTLLETLITSRVFQPDTDASPYWTIKPPEAENELIAVRFVNPEIIFGDGYEQPEPVERLVSKYVENAGEGGGEAVQPAPQPTAIAEEELLPAPESTSAPVKAHNGEEKPEVVPRQQGKKASPEPKAPQGGGIKEAEEQKTSPLPADVAKLFTPLTRDVLGLLLVDHYENKTKGETRSVPEGFAIALERVAAYGADATSIIAELSKAGWLYCPPEKPSKKIHLVSMNNKDTQAIIVREAMARDAGLIK